MTVLTGKKVLLTGGSSGIGQEIALAYAKEGADIALTYKSNVAGAQHTISEIKKYGRKAQAFAIDLTDVNHLNQLVIDAVKFLGNIDILVNNVGTLTRHLSFLEISLDELDCILTVNLKSPFILTQLVAKHMIEHNIKGSIVNITSMSAEIITPGLAHYEASKAAMNTFTKSAASALAQYGIRVNAIAPGLVSTNINKLQRESDPAAWEKRKEKIPLGRVGQASDLSGLAILLASKNSSWITGSVIPADGGIGVYSPFA